MRSLYSHISSNLCSSVEFGQFKKNGNNKRHVSTMDDDKYRLLALENMFFMPIHSRNVDKGLHNHMHWLDKHFDGTLIAASEEPKMYFTRCALTSSHNNFSFRMVHEYI